MTLNNFNYKAERGVAEYYAGTMQPLGVHASTDDYSLLVASPDDVKHRRATSFGDYLIYCNKSSSTGFNIHITNGVKESVVNIKVPTALSPDTYSGDWHLVATENGFRFFFPIENLSGGFYAIQNLQYGEVEIRSNGSLSVLYDLYRSVPSGYESFNNCGFVDVGQDTYFFKVDKGKLRVYNAYFQAVEEQATQPAMDYVHFSGADDNAFGISSSDSDENMILFYDGTNSYGISIQGANDDYTKIFIRPAREVINQALDDIETFEVYETYGSSPSVATTLSSDFFFSRGAVSDGDEIPLWYSRNLGLSIYDQADEAISLVRGSVSRYPSPNTLHYSWLGLIGTRAYVPYFDASDEFYKTMSIIDGTSKSFKTIKQKEFDSDYAPVMIPVQNQKDIFITYYGQTDVHYYYKTVAVPNIIENDKGIFYPQFLGEEEGTVVLDEANYLRYERIGNIVHVFGVVEVASSTGVGALKMNNLPYPISNEFTDVDFTLDQAYPKLTPIKQTGSDYYTLYFCTSQSDQTLTSVATAVALTSRWVFNFRYMTN